MEGTIVRVSGPVVEAKGLIGVKLNEVVRVGNEKLLGEVIRIDKDIATIQVYEETSGLMPSEPVFATGKPLCVELGPGLLGSIYDGVQRPLDLISAERGAFIARGIEKESLDRKKKWEFKPIVKNGESVKEGQIIGKVKETAMIEHKIMVPLGINGKIKGLSEGIFTVDEPIAEIDKQEITMMQSWPVKKARPYIEKLEPYEPLITGQRVIDFLFPIAKGGTAAIPGPFGSGKTVIQHQLAKWADAEIIVYVGCGERGNEMTDVLTELPKLVDQKTGRPLMERTVLIANTSNMPVAAREASVYTGITIAEYYRDQGFNVALMADSTSRWAEALREVSSRLEEMPGEEGYPAYLASRIASFYERSGRVKTLSEKIGSVSVIGAVSPPGGDFSEPVTQNTLRVTKVFWALDASLASRRHFPAINWLSSYSLYSEKTDEWFAKNVNELWPKHRQAAMKLLQKEAELLEIVQIVGPEALPERDRLTLLCARMVREDFLQQNAFHEIDSFCDAHKQLAIIDAIIFFYEEANKLAFINTKEIEKFKSLEMIARLKYLPKEDCLKEVQKVKASIKEEFERFAKETAKASIGGTR